jgi:NAD(P)H-hydrate epimerase
MLALKANATVLAKGPADLIISPGKHSLGESIGLVLDGRSISARTNSNGVPEMSVGGTGDVLAGLTAGLIACGMGGFDAACVAAHINGLAGERARADLGRSLSASSLLDRLSFSQ